jgi:hypothetical protein
MKGSSRPVPSRPDGASAMRRLKAPTDIAKETTPTLGDTRGPLAGGTFPDLLGAQSPVHQAALRAH